MRVIHRFTAALASVLVLQLSLLGTGTLCFSHVSGGLAHNLMEHAMPGMHDQAAIGASVAMAETTVPAPPKGCDPRDTDISCCLPCTSMSSCSVGPSAPAAMVVAAFGQSSPLDLPEALAAKLSHSIAPELPPPRI